MNVVAKIYDCNKCVGTRLYDRGQIRDITEQQFIMGDTYLVNSYANDESKHTDNKISVNGELISGPGYTRLEDGNYIWYNGIEVNPDSEDVITYHLNKYGYHIVEFTDTNMNGIVVAVQGEAGSNSSTLSSEYKVVKVGRDTNEIYSNSWGNKTEKEYRELSNKGRLNMVTKVSKDIDKALSEVPARINKNSLAYSGQPLMLDRCDTEGSVTERLENMVIKAVNTGLCREVPQYFILDTVIGERIIVAKEYVLGKSMDSIYSVVNNYSDYQKCNGGIEIVKDTVIGCKEVGNKLTKQMVVPSQVNRIECRLNAQQVWVQGDLDYCTEDIVEDECALCFSKNSTYTKFIKGARLDIDRTVCLIDYDTDVIKAHIDYIGRCALESMDRYIRKAKRVHNKVGAETRQFKDGEVLAEWTSEFTEGTRELNILAEEGALSVEQLRKIEVQIRSLINNSEMTEKVEEKLREFEYTNGMMRRMALVQYARYLDGQIRVKITHK